MNSVGLKYSCLHSALLYICVLRRTSFRIFENFLEYIDFITVVYRF